MRRLQQCAVQVHRQRLSTNTDIATVQQNTPRRCARHPTSFTLFCFGFFFFFAKCALCVTLQKAHKLTERAHLCLIFGVRWFEF